ncbi:MAG TPA: beta-ketoacyl-ACP synthase II [Spirochaetia bacterium]|nr:beta-ketoacyl-ACP synthase II [Spirochaetia bacterium]
MDLKRAVITGLGAVTPLGNDVATFWKNIQEGRSGAAAITRFDAAKYKTQFACEVKGFDAAARIEGKEFRRMDLFCQYALAAAGEAVENCGVDLETADKERIGVIWSTGIGGISSFQEDIAGFARGDGTPHFNPLFIVKMIGDMSAGVISIKYGFQGMNFITQAACASSTNAIIDAFNYIRLGYADMIVAGGSEAGVTETGIGGFNAMRALSVRNDSPATASRPFDVERDGFVLGEGAGALIVEELEHAKRRGATILAEIGGGGLTADAYHISASHPDGHGAFRGMRNALEDAHLNPSDVDYINTHATSTPVGDVSEMKAIERLFASTLDTVSVSASKSMTGHLMGAAGAVEAIICVMSIQANVVPPTINTSTLDPQINPKIDFVFKESRERQIDVAISNTFGFGGHNAIAVLKRFTK